MKHKYVAWGCMPLIAAGLLCGQEQQQQQQQGDPPSRVARINYINTNLSFRPESQQDWAAATLNYPLTTGDHLWSDQSGGAEMHIGSTALRIAGGTSFSVLNLDDRAVQVSVSQGFMSARVRRLEQGETVEVDTPNGAVSLLGPGDYRIDVNGDTNVTTVTVRAGGAEFNGGGQTFPVNAGQEVRFTGADQLKAEPSQVRAPDQWDQWCISRDEKDDASEENASRYVGRNMTGGEDLVTYGEWRSDPTNGPYWVPPVAAGWEPYRAGHWAFVNPWGWTWIDDDPWGFAPFHYGRWALVGGAWGWFPGAAVVVPVYAPALVAFVGGPEFVSAVGVEAVAWIPLAPGEVYEPYYHVSDVYIRNVNITSVNASRIHAGNGNGGGNYANRSHVTAVRKDSFEGAHRASSSLVRVPSGAANHMQKVNASSYHPGREAYMGRRMDGMKAVTPPRAAVSRPVVVNHAPPSMAGRPAAASYRQAPPVTRRMQMGSQGHYQTAANNGNASRASVPNRTMQQHPNVQQQHPNVQQQRTMTQTQQQRPMTQTQQRPVAQTQQHPNVQQQQHPNVQQQQQRTMTQTQQHPNVQQQQQRTMTQTQQRPVVQQQQQRPMVQQQQRPMVQQQQRPMVQQQQRPNVQQQQRPNVQQQRPAVPQQRPAVQTKQPPHR